MSSQIATLAIDARQPQRVAEFWCAALGWHVLEEEDGLTSIGAPDGSWPTIDVTPAREAKTVKNRLHLDLRADGLPTSAELERLLSLGAQRSAAHRHRSERRRLLGGARRPGGE